MARYGTRRSGEDKRNKLGRLSLIGATVGFLAVELQPWIPLASIGVLGGLALKGLLEAFFEASLAGACADWFAVSALFRDPLVVSLPHTNILAKNKDAIASALPRFLTGFVSPEAIAAVLGKVDFAAKAAEELSAGGSREGLHDFLRRRIGDFLLAYGSTGDEERSAVLAGFVDRILDFASEMIDMPKETASLLSWARENGFDERAIEGLAEYARLEVGRNRPKLVAILTPLIKRNAGWKGLFINAGTVEGFVLGLEDELAELKSDRGNELRRFLLRSLSTYASRLEPVGSGSSVDREKLASSFRDALADPGFRTGVARFAAQLAARLGEDLSRKDGRFIPVLERIEDAAAARLRSDEELRSSFNAAAASLALGVIERGRLVEGATEYLAGLLRATDERVFVDRIEEAVWNDLQYIRLNGAVVGGFVGLVIAFAKAAFGG
jgi:uncharacterized membrane-anchored protein YjiN (DUF445 family)